MNTKNTKSSIFSTRLISGIILILILIFVLYEGKLILFLTTLCLSLIAIYELFKVFKLQNNRFAFIAYIFTVIYYVILYFYASKGILLFLIALTLLLLIFYVFSFPKFTLQQISLFIFSIIYIPIMFSFIYLIREMNELGKYYVWLIFIASWGNDTCAYCFGTLFGKHKLTKILSPKKTIEGALGGIIGSAILGTIYTFIIFNKITKGHSFSYLQIAFACGAGAVISMLGDLTASAIKREYGIKDYGDLIPGHGGILDRFDSVIFAAPTLYFILSI